MDRKLPHDIEGIVVELNLRKKKWLLFGSYHLPSRSDEYFFHQIKRGLDIYSKFYEIGDFHAEESEPCLSQFLFELNAKNIVKEPTFYRSLSNSSRIDLVISNINGVIGISQNGYNSFKTNFSKIFPKGACL